MAFKTREIRFLEGELPDNVSYKTDWELTMAPLRAHRMKWAVLREFPHSGNAYACKVAIGKYYKSRNMDGLFELAVRNVEKGKWEVYGRYIGEELGVQNG